MKRIQLSKQGKNKGKFFALVDDDDYLSLSRYRWNFNASGGGYAERRCGKKNILMHIFLIKTPKGMMVDHKNGNGLDNRRCNLRLATKAQNMMNRGKTVKNKSGYKGVVFDISSYILKKPWKAQIKGDGKTKSIGRFATAKEAAKAYNKAAKIYHGEFAKLNKI